MKNGLRYLTAMICDGVEITQNCGTSLRRGVFLHKMGCKWS